MSTRAPPCWGGCSVSRTRDISLQVIAASCRPSPMGRLCLANPRLRDHPPVGSGPSLEGRSMVRPCPVVGTAKRHRLQVAPTLPKSVIYARVMRLHGAAAHPEVADAHLRADPAEIRAIACVGGAAGSLAPAPHGRGLAGVGDGLRECDGHGRRSTSRDVRRAGSMSPTLTALREPNAQRSQ
jgi:hypothetical protein